MKYVRYQSIGNTEGLPEDIDDYWEIDSEGHVSRSIHFQPDGTLLKYDLEHAADKLGFLPEKTIEDENLTDKAYGICTILSPSDFEEKWKLRAVNRN